MSKQVSLFKFYGNKGLKSKSVWAQRSQCFSRSSASVERCTKSGCWGSEEG